MFRKAAIVLALAASFLGAQATDLPKPEHELGYKNKTKSAHGSTKHGNNVWAKAKTAELCLGGAGGIGFDQGNSASSNNYVSGNFEVFDCATITEMDREAIGFFGFSCTDPQVASSGLAPCTAQLTLNTDWHKKSDVSSLALSFFTSTEEWGNNNLNDIRENFNIVASVITGTTGAWPSKVGAISNIGLTYVDNYEFPYILDIAYKGRGWNPAYSK